MKTGANPTIMSAKPTAAQFIWGVMLLLAGIGVFFRVHQVMPDIRSIPTFSQATGIIRFCFYFVGIVLVGGGIRKILANYPAVSRREPETGGD